MSPCTDYLFKQLAITTSKAITQTWDFKPQLKDLIKNKDEYF